jgi:hypothetical protein
VLKRGPVFLFRATLNTRFLRNPRRKERRKKEDETKRDGARKEGELLIFTPFLLTAEK